MKNFIYILLLFAIPACSETISARVSYVYDGDTVTLTSEKTKTKIRLYGIDAPEIAQPYGKESRNHLRKKILYKNVEVKVNGKDRYKRTIGTIFLDGENINLWMIKSGFAWHYKQYCKDKVFAIAERNAKNKKIEMWKTDNLQRPDLFRKDKRRKQR